MLNLRRNTQLPAYDPNRSCPKCKGTDIRTSYRNDGCSDPDCRQCPPEHLRRICQRCHYAWAEAPADV